MGCWTIIGKIFTGKWIFVSFLRAGGFLQEC